MCSTLNSNAPCFNVQKPRDNSRLTSADQVLMDLNAGLDLSYGFAHFGEDLYSTANPFLAINEDHIILDENAFREAGAKDSADVSLPVQSVQVQSSNRSKGFPEAVWERFRATKPSYMCTEILSSRRCRRLCPEEHGFDA